VAREIQRARAELATAGAELARGRAVLASRIGADAGIELKPTGTPLPPPPPPLSELRERLPERHDFAALLARADAADRELQSATRAWIPELTVGIGNRVIETAGNVNDRVMLSLSMPLPVFNRGQAAARRAAALREGLRAEHALRRSRLDGELEGLWQQASQLHAAASEFRREALTVSRELMQIARTAYTAGEGSVLDLIDAWRTELDAELTSLDLDYRARLARIELDRIAGVTAHD
jgi:cobalt-zinc-cadmium efflux system outer membrane protein